MNKKAIAGSLVDFVSLLVIGLTFLVFFVLFRISTDAKNHIQEEAFPELYGDQFLLNYLKTPVQHQGDVITMADYLSIAAQDSSDVDELVKYPVVKSTLDAYLEKEGGCYFFSAQVDLRVLFEIRGDDGTSPCTVAQKYVLSPFPIPLNDGRQLRVRLLASPRVAK